MRSHPALEKWNSNCLPFSRCIVNQSCLFSRLGQYCPYHEKNWTDLGHPWIPRPEGLPIFCRGGRDLACRRYRRRLRIQPTRRLQTIQSRSRQYRRCQPPPPIPLDLRFDCEGLDVWITHIGGYPGRYNQRVKEILKSHPPGLFICGHSHILKVMPDQQFNLLHINPGAAGKQGFHQVKTIVRFAVENGRVRDLEVVEMGDSRKL